MIAHLQVEGLAVIDRLEIDFGQGFNVITGETGAGKSILIKALNTLLGVKISAEHIRPGRDSANVSGTFLVAPSHPVLQELIALGVSADAEGVPFGTLEVEPLSSDRALHPLLLRRQIHARPRTLSKTASTSYTQSWINDTPVSSAALRKAASLLIDIFGQHENQKLLHASSHIQYLDAFLDDAPLRERYSSVYRTLTQQLQTLQESVDGFHSRDRESDYLDFRLEELRKFNPEVADYNEILELCQRGEKLEALRAPIGRAVNLLSGEGTSPGEMVWAACKELAKADPASSPSGLNEISERLNVVATELDDLSFSLGQLSESLVDPGDMDRVQTRLFGYQDLFRKHGVNAVEELVRAAEKIELERTSAAELMELTEKQLTDIRALIQEARDCAELLGKARTRAARKTEKRVEEELGDLSMRHARFEVRFEPVHRTPPVLNLRFLGEDRHAEWTAMAEAISTLGPQGGETAEFFLSANPGQPALKLSAVASGGEVSRIMLAIKKALAADAETCVLVFDEIDTGISGRIADCVGKKLADLSHKLQVLCISHLPQVAVYGDSHYLVAKKSQGQKTETQIRRLAPDEVASEIARLLSADEVSTESLAQAHKLLERAGGAKATREDTLAPRAKKKSPKSPSSKHV